jgi:hypothetical protein
MLPVVSPVGCSQQISMQIFVSDFNLPLALWQYPSFLTFRTFGSYRLLLPIDHSVLVTQAIADTRGGVGL